MMHAATAAEYGAWLRWYHLPIFLGVFSQILFVHAYLGTSTAWLMLAAILARSFVIIVNFSVYPNYNFASIGSLRTVSLLGDQISAIGAAVPRTTLQSFAVASLLLLLACIADAAFRSWRKGGADGRRKAIAVGLGIGLPTLCSVLYTQLLVFGVLHGPVSNIPWFLGTLSMMAYISGRDFVLSRRARLEVAELRSQMAQIERVSLLGQLASALAHELSQPLSAISMNVGVARKHLKQAPPDLGELNAILDDIGADKSRAVEIISRMRELFKQRRIELTPIRIDEVVANAVSLIAAEANARRVTVRWNIQPGVPPVSGDAVHLSQVLLNLLMNGIQAVQSCPIDARLVVLSVHTDEARGEVEVCVRDSGPGIPSLIDHRIFQPLFTTKAEGMGMGLALSRSIIEAHGGRMWADEPREHEGAAFHFTLRRA